MDEWVDKREKDGGRDKVTSSTRRKGRKRREKVERTLGQEEKSTFI